MQYFFFSLSLLTQNYVVLGLFYYPMFYLFSPLYLPLLHFAILPTTFIFSQKQSCTQALPQPSSSPFLLVSQEQASRIPKTFNPKKKKKHNLLDAVWVLSKCGKAKGNRIGFSFLLLVSSLNIFMILSVFFFFVVVCVCVCVCLLGVWELSCYLLL